MSGAIFWAQFFKCNKRQLLSGLEQRVTITSPGNLAQCYRHIQATTLSLIQAGVLSHDILSHRAVSTIYFRSFGNNTDKEGTTKKGLSTVRPFYWLKSESATFSEEGEQGVPIPFYSLKSKLFPFYSLKKFIFHFPSKNNLFYLQ